MKNNLELPKDGLAGLKENFASDAASGFIVFLLALPEDNKSRGCV
jgi:hypothetical protein